MTDPRIAFGTEFLSDIPPTEYGCGCNDDGSKDASVSGSDYIDSDPILRQMFHR